MTFILWSDILQRTRTWNTGCFTGINLIGPFGARNHDGHVVKSYDSTTVPSNHPKRSNRPDQETVSNVVVFKGGFYFFYAPSTRLLFAFYCNLHSFSTHEMPNISPLRFIKLLHVALGPYIHDLTFTNQLS